MNDLIKEVAFDTAAKLATDHWLCGDDEVLEFATKFLTELSKRAEAVAKIQKHTGSLKDMAIIVWTNEQPPEGTKLFTFPPIHDIESLHQQLAECQATNGKLRSDMSLFLDSHEECEDFDGFTAQIVSMDDYHKAQDALALALPNDATALNELIAERTAELTSWKQQAITVLNEIDLQEIGKVLGVGLGESVGPHILPAIKKLTLLTKDTGRLDLIDKNYLEISACGGWEEEPTFSVLKVTGNRNDREFKRIGRGDTIREAIDAATANCKELE